tara:strand:+ start:292989 stop:293540 length:552 start_codon:yes stop_codon:yes gene_type:complete
MRAIYLIAVLLLGACSGQPVTQENYLLRPAVAPGSATAVVESGYALGAIRVANYIDQPGLVITRGDGKIHSARNHVWAEPLQVSLRRYLAVEVSGSSGRDIAASTSSATKTRIDVTIDELHGNGSGAAVLVAYWDVAGDEGSKSFRFAEDEALSGDGYDALVNAEEALLKRLAKAIAASLPPV